MKRRFQIERVGRRRKSAARGKPDDPDVIVGRKLPWRTAAEIIDWSLPCHSIFLSREEGRAVGVNRPLADATMTRLARGVKRYVIDATKPFIVRTDMASAAARNGLHGVDEPVRTMTTGGSFAVTTPFVTKFRSNSTGHELDEPLHTVTANGDNRARPGGAAPLGLIAPILVGCGGRAGQSRPRSADEPTATGTAKADVCIVAAHLQRQFGALIGSDAGEPVGTITAGCSGKTALAAVAITKFSENSTGHLPDEPLHTVMAGAPRHGVVAAFLAQHNTGLVGHHAEEPVSTIVGKGCTKAVVEASVLSHQYTSNTAGGSGDVDDPIKTVTAGGLHAAEVRAFLIKYYGGAIGQECDDPMHTVVTKDRYGLVTVDIGGEPYVIADIGMRMLSPRELFRAQGFPDHYIIDRGLSVEPPPEGWGDEGPCEVIPLTKTAQVRMCGNSVCPPLAQALVAANFRERVEAEKPSRPIELPLFAMEAAE